MKKILITFFFALITGLVWAYLHFKKSIHTYDQLLDRTVESKNQHEQDHENSNENLEKHISGDSKRSWHKWADAHPHKYMKWTPKKILPPRHFLKIRRKRIKKMYPVYMEQIRKSKDEKRSRLLWDSILYFIDNRVTFIGTVH